MKMRILIVFVLAGMFVSCAKESSTHPELVNRPPTCVISQPPEGASFILGDTVEIRVDASDEDGQLVHVKFYVDDQVRHYDLVSPYTYLWDLSQEAYGQHVIRAVAIDDEDARSTDAVSVTMDWMYQPPEQVNDGWETASLGSAGMDSTRLLTMMNTINNHEDHRIHGIVIARHGRLVFEEYFHGYRRDDQNTLVHFTRSVKHDLASATKSFTSALLGVAIDRGFIRGVDQPVYEFFPEFEWMASGTKADITLEHMITMSSGLQWNQHSYPTLDPRNDLMIFAMSATPWHMYLSRPLEENPGTHINYCGASINVVGECIRRSSGLRLDQFADEYLFDKIDILDRRWNVKSSEWIWASGDLSLGPRDMLKFGQLYLQSGVWDEEQVVSREWAEGALEPYFIFDNFPSHRQNWASVYDIIGYSYAWWTLDAATYGQNAFTAAGWGDQRIMVLPELDMVVGFTGGSQFEDPLMTSHEMMVRYILPSIQ